MPLNLSYRRALLLASVLVFASCNCSPPQRTVKVRLADVTHELDGGTSVFEPPTNVAPVEAWVRLESGEWQTFEAKWVDAGLAELAVPEGFMYVARPLSIILGEAQGDALDVSTVFYGETFTNAGSGTTVSFDIDQAEGATPSTVTSIFLPNTGQQRDNLSAGLGPQVFPVTPDSGTHYAYRMPWGGLPLFRRAENVFVYQAADLDGGWALARRGVVKVMPSSGRDVKAPMVTLSALPAAAVPFAPVDVALNGLENDFVGALPNGSLVNLALEFTASIDSTRAVLPLAMRYAQGPSVSMPEVGVDPLPGLAWTQRQTLHLLTSSALQLELSDGGTVDQPIPLASSFSAPPADFTLSNTTLLSPPRNVRLDGEPSGQTLTLTPVVAWDAPVDGTADRYSVTPVRFLSEPFGVEFGPTFRVARTKCPIPPKVLVGGSQYFFVVNAENCGTTTLDTPFKRTEQPRCASAVTRSLVFNTPFE